MSTILVEWMTLLIISMLIATSRMRQAQQTEIVPIAKSGPRAGTTHQLSETQSTRRSEANRPLDKLQALLLAEGRLLRTDQQSRSYSRPRRERT